MCFYKEIHMLFYHKVASNVYTTLAYSLQSLL